MSQSKNRRQFKTPGEALPQASDPVTLPPPGLYDAVISPVGSTGPITQPYLPHVSRTKLDKTTLKQLRIAVSGPDGVTDEPFSHDEAPTSPMPAILSHIQNPIASTTRGLARGSFYSLSNFTPTGLNLLICAVMQHMQDFQVIPTYVCVSATLFSKIIGDMETVYRIKFRGEVPFLIGNDLVRFIPLFINDAIPEDTVLCED